MSRKKKVQEDKKKLILLVEDDIFLSGMYKTKLELEEYKVVVAEDGEKGFALIKRYKPNLVLLDIVLPKMSGFEVLKRMKKNRELSMIPVILLTNLSQKEDVQKGVVLGVDDYLIKAHYMPFEVVTKIKKFLDSKKS